MRTYRLPLTRIDMAAPDPDKPLDDFTPEPYTDTDIDNVRTFWAEANPDSDTLLDADTEPEGE